MSKSLGSVALPNGGTLEVTAYVGPARSRRVQFTLTQGEGHIVAYGNTDADGVAELVGILETWLLEGGQKPAALWAGVPTATVYAGLSRALELITRELEHEPDRLGLEVWRDDLTAVKELIFSALELIPPPVTVTTRAAIDGPSQTAIAEQFAKHVDRGGTFSSASEAELAREVHNDYGRALAEMEAARLDGLEMPRLEPMNVIPLELEDGHIRHAAVPVSEQLRNAIDRADAALYRLGYHGELGDSERRALDEAREALRDADKAAEELTPGPLERNDVATSLEEFATGERSETTDGLRAAELEELASGLTGATGRLVEILRAIAKVR